MDTRSSSRIGSGSYSDKKGTQWTMYGKGDGGDSRLEEGRGGDESIRMEEWPRRRESSDWKKAFG